jgi:hypothetical protein
MFIGRAYINSNVAGKQREQIIPIEFEVGTTNSSGIGPGIVDGLQRDGEMKAYISYVYSSFDPLIQLVSLENRCVDESISIDNMKIGERNDKCMQCTQTVQKVGK